MAIRNFKLTFMMGKDSGVANLSAFLRIERCAIENHHAFLSLCQRIDKFSICDKRHDGPFCTGLLISQEFTNAMFFDIVFKQTLFHFLSVDCLCAARTLFSLLFEKLISIEIDLQSSIFGDQQDFFDRKTISVFEFKSISSSDLFLGTFLRLLDDGV